MARRSRSQGKDPWRSSEEDSLLARLLLWGVVRLAMPIRCFGIEPGHFRELLRVRVLLSLRPSSAKPSVWGLAGIAVSMLMTTVLPRPAKKLASVAMSTIGKPPASRIRA